MLSGRPAALIKIDVDLPHKLCTTCCKMRLHLWWGGEN